MAEDEGLWNCKLQDEPFDGLLGEPLLSEPELVGLDSFGLSPGQFMPEDTKPLCEDGVLALCTRFPKATVVIRVVGHALLEGKLYAVGGFG